MKVAGRVTRAEKSEPRGRQHGHYRPESKFPSSYPRWVRDPGLRHSVPPSVKRRQPLCPDGAEWGWLEPRDQDVRALRHLWDASSSVTTRSLRVAHGHHPVAPSAWTPLVSCKAVTPLAGIPTPIPRWVPSHLLHRRLACLFPNISKSGGGMPLAATVHPGAQMGATFVTHVTWPADRPSPVSLPSALVTPAARASLSPSTRPGGPQPAPH